MSIYKKISVFEEFKNGVLEGLQLLRMILPTMMALSLWTNCLLYCGILQFLQSYLLSFLSFLDIPIEVFTMMILRPFSSQGSLNLLNHIYQTYGVDHRYSLLASIIQTGSDTTFYVVHLYFSQLKMTSYRYTLILGLILDGIAVLLAILIYLTFF